MKRLVLLTLTLVLFAACSSSPSEKIRGDHDLGAPEDFDMESTEYEEGYYINGMQGVRFRLADDWPQPKTLDAHGLYWLDELGGVNLWNLGLGEINKGACEGVDCYWTQLAEWEGFSLDDVRLALEEDALMGVISEEKIGEFDVLHATVSGICGSLKSFVTNGERMFIYTSRCTLSWDQESQETNVPVEVMTELQTVISSLEVL